MSTHFIPPKGQAAIKRELVESIARETLRPYIKTEKKLNVAVVDLLKNLSGYLNIPQSSGNLSTVMTEAASMRSDAGGFKGVPKTL